MGYLTSVGLLELRYEGQWLVTMNKKPDASRGTINIHVIRVADNIKSGRIRKQ